jgi:hypothetical protein
LDKLANFDESREIEAPTDAPELANFICELLLVFNPGAVGGGRKFGNAALAERRGSVPAQKLKQRIEFEHAR